MMPGECSPEAQFPGMLTKWSSSRCWGKMGFWIPGQLFGLSL